MMPQATFPSTRMTLPPGAELYLFSDGVYEIMRPDGSWQTWEDFARYLREDRPPIEAIAAKMRGVHGAEEFEDDFSLLQMKMA
jgi:sigma-B regulation protein RsbU (phosphoserine phosphatase)